VTGFRLKHVERFRDRKGRIRYYYRKGHGPRTPLPGAPGTEPFMAAYAAASTALLPDIGAKRHAPGTFSALVVDYLRSPEFRKHGKATQEVTRRIVERFAAKHGKRLVKQMTRDHVSKILGDMADTPAAANNLLKRLRVLMRLAIAKKLRDADPTFGFKKYKEGEHHTWTEAEVAKFEKMWPVGSRERAAFALAIYTGQRRADLCRMAWADISGTRIHVVQGKTDEKLWIPIHPELRKALDALPVRGSTLITTKQGKPFVLESFGNFMAKAIDRAGLPSRCVLHGLRKAIARRLAEAGCTEKQIASITGHRTLSEVARYTKAASQEKLADDAMEKMSVGIRGETPNDSMR
jgi:integrase